jgi:hypothetical protein
MKKYKITSMVDCKPKLNGEHTLILAIILERSLTDSCWAEFVLGAPNWKLLLKLAIILERPPTDSCWAELVLGAPNWKLFHVGCWVWLLPKK